MKKNEETLVIIDWANFNERDSHLVQLKSEYDLQLEKLNNLKKSNNPDKQLIKNQLEMVNKAARKLNADIEVTKDSTF
jgi:hypothetical protein